MYIRIRVYATLSSFRSPNARALRFSTRVYRLLPFRILFVPSIAPAHRSLLLLSEEANAPGRMQMNARGFIPSPGPGLVVGREERARRVFLAQRRRKKKKKTKKKGKRGKKTMIDSAHQVPAVLIETRRRKPLSSRSPARCSLSLSTFLFIFPSPPPLSLSFSRVPITAFPA